MTALFKRPTVPALLFASVLSACNRTPPAASQPAPAAPPALVVPATGAYVTNEVSGDLTVIDLATQSVVATIPLGKRPRGIRLSPDGTRLYVALSGSPIAGPGVDEKTLPPADKSADGIGVVDIRQGKLVTILHSGSDPETVAVSQDLRDCSSRTKTRRS
jgi:YVTN family beta-propeller protein